METESDGRNRPSVGEGSISGHNLFVSAYHGFATLGNEHVPEPLRFEEFPSFRMEFISAKVEEGGNLVMRFCLSIDGSDDPLRYRTLGKIQLVEAGKGCNPGKMRNVLSSETSNIPANQREILFSIPDYKSVWNLDIQEYTCHIRYLLLDTVTGYRNLYHKLSCSFSL